MHVEIPDDVGSVLGKDPQRYVLEAVLIRLLHDDVASIAYAAEQLGMSRRDALKWYLDQGYKYDEEFTSEDIAEMLRFRLDDEDS